MPLRTLAILAALSLPGVALGDIVRCVAPGGAVTYQSVPCDGAHLETRPPIPSEFPPANTAERERLLAREAALDRRLEARRDRETQEAIARAERQAREELARAEMAAAAAERQQYVIAYPYWRPAHTSRVGNHVPHGPRPTPLVFR